MKKIIFAFFLLSTLFVLINSCTNNENSNNNAVKTKDPQSTCNKPTIMDPNMPKPMALMMRSMAANTDSMKAKILHGETLDSLQFPFIRFYLVEPTDKNVLEPMFFENAKIFQKAYTSLFAHKNEQKKYYNLMINACINCHESYCSGPLRRIKKMPLNE